MATEHNHDAAHGRRAPGPGAAMSLNSPASVQQEAAGDPGVAVPGDGRAPAACERCGSFDASEIGGQFLCADCVALAGCGCAGSNNDE